MNTKAKTEKCAARQAGSGSDTSVESTDSGQTASRHNGTGQALNRPAENASEQYIVKPVQKALLVLIALGEERGALTLTEICHRVRLPKTTVYRYLQTLCHLGFVAHNAEQDRYLLGHRLFELGQLAGEQLRIRDIALPYMQALRERFNETVNLGLLDGTEVVYVEMVESHHTLRMRAALGSRDPVYSTALGKAMLAFVPKPLLERHLPTRFTPRTQKTVGNRQELTTVLAKVRELGYAVDDGENEDDTRCVGAPIFDYTGEVIAAISLSAPATRMSDAQLAEVAQEVTAAAAAISHSLGYTDSPIS
jgi:DNA-binding IclR family transcriptional regulator